MDSRIIYRVHDHDSLTRFVARGYRPRQFFPHRTYTIPKCGPNAAFLFREMVGDDEGVAYWTLTLHADGEAQAAFPPDLFFDDDLIWHRQHYGQPGHVAYAAIALQGDVLHGLSYVSDVVQRQARQPALRSRIENRFGGWRHLLVNALLGFAADNGITTIRSPSAELVLRNTDRNRSPKPPLFERVYDETLRDHYEGRRDGDWWVLDVARNRDRIVVPRKESEPLASGQRICLFHDLERGLGHRDSDPDFAARVEAPSDGWLDEMLAVEKAAGWRATYNVVGCLHDAVRSRIEGGGHCIAFHSFDHRIDDEGGQLAACRRVDYRTRGYRPPQSVLTAEITARSLRRYGFDWLASSRGSLGIGRSRLRDHLVYIPVQFDDYPLHCRRMDYPAWEAQALETIARGENVAFGLHDCYADQWLPHYARLLARLRELGSCCTLDELADRIFLGACA